MYHWTGHPTPAPSVQRLRSRAENAKAILLKSDVDEMRAVLGRTDAIIEPQRRTVPGHLHVAANVHQDRRRRLFRRSADPVQHRLSLVIAKKNNIEHLIPWLGEVCDGETRAAEAQI